MSERRRHHHNNKNDKKTSSLVGGDSCVKTEASTTSTTTRTNTSPQLQHEKETTNKNRVELLVQEIGLEAVWRFVTVIQELGFDSVLKIINQISKEQQQQSGSTTDNNAAIPYSVASSSSAAAAPPPPPPPPRASLTHPVPARAPVAFIEKDLAVKREPEEEEVEKGEREAPPEPRGAAPTSGGTAAAAAAATAAYPEQQPLPQHNDENNSRHETVKLDAHPTKSNKRSKRKRQSPSVGEDGVGRNPGDNNLETNKKTKKTMKNRQGGKHTDYETTTYQKQPAKANKINNDAPDGNINSVLNHPAEEDYAIDTNNDSSTKDNCCRFCNDPAWESKIYYKCGTVLSKYFPISINNPNPGWYKGTIRMHHVEAGTVNISEGGSEQQSIIFNEIHYEDGDMENITQDDLKKLEEIGFDLCLSAASSNNKYDRTWLDKYHRLERFKTENGHCLVPQKYAPDPSLAIWVHNQRMRCKKGKMAADRKEKLNKLGFEWNPAAKTKDLSSWQEKYNRLKKFKDDNGHC